MTNQLTSLILAFSLLACPSCATVRRHPKATALVAGAAAGVAIGYKLGHQSPCPSVVSGYPYNGTPPCPTSCSGLGDCYWPPKK